MYMDKAAADIREFLMDIIEDPVHHMVADIGSGGVGQTGRISGVLDGLDHGLHGKIAEVRGIPIRKYRLVNGLVSFVIGDPASVMLMLPAPAYVRTCRLPGRRL